MESKESPINGPKGFEQQVDNDSTNQRESTAPKDQSPQPEAAISSPKSTGKPTNDYAFQSAEQNGYERDGSASPSTAGSVPTTTSKDQALPTKPSVPSPGQSHLQTRPPIPPKAAEAAEPAPLSNGRPVSPPSVANPNAASSLSAHSAPELANSKPQSSPPQLATANATPQQATHKAELAEQTPQTAQTQQIMQTSVGKQMAVPSLVKPPMSAPVSATHVPQAGGDQLQPPMHAVHGQLPANNLPAFHLQSQQLQAGHLPRPHPFVSNGIYLGNNYHPEHLQFGDPIHMSNFPGNGVDHHPHRPAYPQDQGEDSPSVMEPNPDSACNTPDPQEMYLMRTNPALFTLDGFHRHLPTPELDQTHYNYANTSPFINHSFQTANDSHINHYGEPNTSGLMKPDIHSRLSPLHFARQELGAQNYANQSKPVTVTNPKQLEDPKSDDSDEDYSPEEDNDDEDADPDVQIDASDSQGSSRAHMVSISSGKSRYTAEEDAFMRESKKAGMQWKIITAYARELYGISDARNFRNMQVHHSQSLAKKTGDYDEMSSEKKAKFSEIFAKRFKPFIQGVSDEFAQIEKKKIEVDEIAQYAYESKERSRLKMYEAIEHAKKHQPTRPKKRKKSRR